MTNIVIIIFYCLVHKSLHLKFGKMVQWFMRKASFNFDLQITLGQGQKMTLTLNTHIPSFSQLLVCIYQAAIVSLKSYCIFLVENPKLRI